MFVCVWCSIAFLLFFFYVFLRVFISFGVCLFMCDVALLFLLFMQNCFLLLFFILVFLKVFICVGMNVYSFRVV